MILGAFNLIGFGAGGVRVIMHFVFVVFVPCLVRPVHTQSCVRASSFACHLASVSMLIDPLPFWLKPKTCHFLSAMYVCMYVRNHVGSSLRSHASLEALLSDTKVSWSWVQCAMRPSKVTYRAPGGSYGPITKQLAYVLRQVYRCDKSLQSRGQMVCAVKFALAVAADGVMDAPDAVPVMVPRHLVLTAKSNLASWLIHSQRQAEVGRTTYFAPRAFVAACAQGIISAATRKADLHVHAEAAKDCHNLPLDPHVVAQPASAPDPDVALSPGPAPSKETSAPVVIHSGIANWELDEVTPLEKEVCGDARVNEEKDQSGNYCTTGESTATVSPPTTQQMATYVFEDFT